MKKLCFCFVFIVIYSLSAFGQLKFKVDERFELTSIVFRLAGAEEYSQCQVEPYSTAIDTYFEPYKNHPLIQYVREIRERDEVCYTDVSSSAYLLVIEKNRVRIHPDADIDEYFKEWVNFTKETLTKYVSLLNDFYRDTRFRKFFDSQAALHRQAEELMDEMLAYIEPDWFQSFFGEPFGNPSVYVSMVNGPSNYALSSNIPGIDYGILMGSLYSDARGALKANTQPVVEVIVHELCHHFVNPIVEKWMERMRSSADIIFPYVKDMLIKVAYGDAETMIFEAINNLCESMYFRELISPDAMFHQASGLERRGFVWMERMMRFMDNFYKDRHLYPRFEDFMPQIAGFMDGIAADIEQVMFDYEHRAPHIISVYPAPGSIVSPDIKEFRITFSRDMDDSYSYSKLEDPAYKSALTGELKWIDSKTIVFPIEAVLEPDAQYGFKLMQWLYRSVTGHPMKSDYVVKFRTTKQ